MQMILVTRKPDVQPQGEWVAAPRAGAKSATAKSGHPGPSHREAASHAASLAASGGAIAQALAYRPVSVWGGRGPARIQHHPAAAR